MNLRSRSKNRFVLLDLTPLIDVVFLLLIFFMVSTSFDRQKELKIELPEVSQEQSKPKKRQTVNIIIDRQGQFKLNDRIYRNKSALQKALSALKSDQPILIQADKQAPFQSIMDLMDLAAQLGLNQLRFLGIMKNDTE